ncbi:MAG: endonuclease III [Spirochaetaceae bacterium]|nr:MAG: endonuclease III [Spirochaetaceae bacterium]
MTTSTTSTSDPPPASEIRRVFAAVRRFVARHELPSVSLVAVTSRDPFSILVSTVLSLRTRDDVTLAATRRLVAVAPTVNAVLTLSEDRIAELIYPCGFYRTKARQLLQIARIIRDQHNGTVPADRDALLAMPGVGRKTANLVLGLSFGIPAICVDTHVHRICNRLGWIRSRTPDESERLLEQFVPKRLWIEINELLVLFGQQTCTPQSPRCSLCPIAAHCRRVGVTRSR